MRRPLPAFAASCGAGRAAEEGGSPDGRLTRLAEAVRRSAALREARRRGVPPIRYDDDLPVSAKRDEIARAIRDHQVVIVCGETGSGKSTQLPKICLEMGRGDRRPDRPHAAPPHCRPQRGGADRRGTGLAAGPRRGLQGPLRRGPLAADLHQADDRRHPPGRDPGRPVPGPIRHDHPGRGPRAVAEHRLSHRLLEAAAAEAAGPEADHHLGHDRRGPLQRPLRHARTAPRRWSRFPGGRFRSRSAGGRRWPTRRAARPTCSRPCWRPSRKLAAIDRGDILIFMPTERHIHETAKTLRGRPLPGDPTGRRDGDPAALRPAVDTRAAAASSSRARNAASSSPPTWPSRR